MLCQTERVKLQLCYSTELLRWRILLESIRYMYEIIARNIMIFCESNSSVKSYSNTNSVKLARIQISKKTLSKLNKIARAKQNYVKNDLEIALD